MNASVSVTPTQIASSFACAAAPWSNAAADGAAPTQITSWMISPQRLAIATNSATPASPASSPIGILLSTLGTPPRSASPASWRNSHTAPATNATGDATVPIPSLRTQAR